MKEVHDFEERDEQPRFDVKYVNKGANEITIWGDAEMIFPDSTLRELTNNTYDYLSEDYEMWIKDPQLFDDESPKISDEFIPYIMALTVHNMSEDELPLSFRIVNGCFVIGRDNDSGFKDAKEFYEKFYHLIFGFNYGDSDAELIPEGELEAEEYIEQKHREFDEKMKSKLGDRYLPGNKSKQQ